MTCLSPVELPTGTIPLCQGTTGVPAWGAQNPGRGSQKAEHHPARCVPSHLEKQASEREAGGLSLKGKYIQVGKGTRGFLEEGAV